MDWSTTPDKKSHIMTGSQHKSASADSSMVLLLFNLRSHTYYDTATAVQ